jgi:hypothetical protein
VTRPGIEEKRVVPEVAAMVANRRMRGRSILDGVKCSNVKLHLNCHHCAVLLLLLLLLPRWKAESTSPLT